MIEEFLRIQGSIRETLAQGEAILIRPDDPDCANLEQLRWRMAQQLRRYRLLKHERMLPAFLASKDPVVRKIAADMKTRCDALADLYRQFLDRWTPQAMHDEKAAYRSNALDMIGRLRRHLEREAMDVRRLAEKSADTPGATRGYGRG